MSNDLPRIDIIKLTKELENEGFIPTKRRGPTGIGFTLESRLGIYENNSDIHDFADIGKYSGTHFELKTQRRRILNPIEYNGWRNNKSMISLVTQSPHGGMTNKCLIEKYGYPDSKEINKRNLYTTLRCNRYTNGRKIKCMKSNRERNYLYIVHGKTNLSYYNLSLFGDKLKNLIVFRADAKNEFCKCENIHFHDDKTKQYHEYFYFNEVTIFLKLNKNKFYELLDTGKINLDIRMHIKYDRNIDDELKNHDHGTALRIPFQHIQELYEKFEQI